MAKSAAKPGRGSATRAMIIERSAPLFNQRGYAGTSMSELMEATGLEKGGLYRHFESKEALAAAAFDYAWEEVFTHRMRGVDACEGCLEKLRLFVRNFVEGSHPALSGGCPLLNTAIDSDDGDPVLRERARAALTRLRHTLVEIISQGRRSGEVRPGVEPVKAVHVMISALEGAVMMSRLERTRGPLRNVGHHLEEYLGSLAT